MCKRKIFSLLIAMVLLCINGCSYPESTEESSSETSVVEKPMEIRIEFWNIQDYLKGDPLQTYVEEKFNVKFIPANITYDNYNSVLQELAVSDNLPDIFTHDIMGTSAYENWIQEGKIRSVPKDLSAYPNLETYLDQPYTQRFRHSDGFFYAIPRMTYPNEELWALDRCVLLRKDWMQNLGLSEPQSWEEFVDLLYAFVYEDPDGNGIDDTQGLATVNLYTLEVLYLSIFPELSNTERGWIYEDKEPDFYQQLRQKVIELRNTTDKALMIVCGCNLFEWGTFLRRIDNFLMDIYTEPEQVERLVAELTERHLQTLEKVCEAVGDVVDILRFGDDLGMDSGLFMAPEKYRQIFKPYHRKLCDYVHSHSQMKTFLHSCGSIYPIIGDLIDAGYDILNPVQTSARQMEPETLKREFGRDITFWGGGCNTRTILNLATPREVYDYTRRMIEIFLPGGGFVFNQEHNILPDVPPENILAMLQAVQDARGQSFH